MFSRKYATETCGVRQRFPFGSLAAVLLTSFALGCCLMNEWRAWIASNDELLTGEPALPIAHDYLTIGARVLPGLVLIVALVTQVHILVERAQRQPRTVAEPAAAQVGECVDSEAVAAADADRANVSEEAASLPASGRRSERPAVARNGRPRVPAVPAGRF